MAWVRLTDDFYDHPKLIAAGPLAAWLWVCGLAYANRHLTDGYLPAAAVRRLADLDDPLRLAAKLVDATLWAPADGGYTIHDYAEYQPTADAVRAERAKTAERVANWRKRQAESTDDSNAVTNASGNGVTNGVGNAPCNAAPGPARPGPVNTPDPARFTTPPLPPSPQAEKGERRNPRRRSGSGSGEIPGEPTAPPSEVTLAAPTDDDLALWQAARALMADEMNAGNYDLVCTLEPAGRGADGGLRLRAPPAMAGLGRFRPIVARALYDAGDSEATHAAILDAKG